MDVLTTVDQLAAALDSGSPPVVLDVRWTLGGPPGRKEFEAGHVPGAVFVDLATELAGRGEPTDGRHPLPSTEALQEAARTWGVHEGDAVVAYDGGGNLAAARAWWLLRHAGLPEVRLLDGALPAWVAAGRPLESGASRPERGDVTLASGSMPVLEFQDVARFATDAVLLDARAAERYRGEVEPIDPKAGHVPGAVSAPTADLVDADGRFRSPEDLRAHFAARGIDGTRPVAAYCGSGVTAAHEVAALAIAGFDAALYPGSWSQWSNLDLPVATGPR